MPKEPAISPVPAEIAAPAAPAEASVAPSSIQLAPVAPVAEVLPQAGGSYVRQESGELKRVEHSKDAGPTLATDPTDLIEGE